MDDNTVVYKLELTSHLYLGWKDCDRHTGKEAKTPRSLHLCNEVYPSLLMLSKEQRAGAMDVGTYRCMSPSVTPQHLSHLGKASTYYICCHTIPTLLPPRFECSTRALRRDSSCSGCTCVSSGCFSSKWPPRSSLCLCDATPECIYSLPER